MPPQPEPGAPSEKGRSPSAELASVSAGDCTKRARTPRILNKVSILGEIYLTKSGYRDVVPRQRGFHFINYLC